MPAKDFTRQGPLCDVVPNSREKSSIDPSRRLQLLIELIPGVIRGVLALLYTNFTVTQARSFT